MAWRSDVRLECRAVGVPEPQRQWLVVDTPYSSLHPSIQARLAIATDGALLITSAQRSDQGDYTCVVSNEHGRDRITYHLLVQGLLPYCIYSLCLLNPNKFVLLTERDCRLVNNLWSLVGNEDLVFIFAEPVAESHLLQ